MAGRGVWPEKRDDDSVRPSTILLLPPRHLRPFVTLSYPSSQHSNEHFTISLSTQGRSLLHTQLDRLRAVLCLQHSVWERQHESTLHRSNPTQAIVWRHYEAQFAYIHILPRSSYLFDKPPSKSGSIKRNLSTLSSGLDTRGQGWIFAGWKV